MNANETENRKRALAMLRHAASDEQSAVEYFEQLRWGESGACCPRCGSVGVHRIMGKDGQREKAMRWKCRDCARQYSVRTGTVYEESRLPMRVWAHAFWRCCASKKGVSALQIKRETGIGYRAALFMMHRIRFAMAEQVSGPSLTGTVEADETYVGGKPRRRNYEMTGSPTLKRGPRKQGALAPVLGIVQRGGNLRLRHTPNVTSKNLYAFVTGHAWIDRSTLMTDENPKYLKPGRRFAGGHHTVSHRIKEYARGPAHTNTIESAFALLKRGLYGTFHAVSQEHLHRYCAEFEFRYNTRKVDDADRILRAVKAGEGKRLRYREQSSPARAA